MLSFVCVIYILYYVVDYEISAGHKPICNQFSYSFYAYVYFVSVCFSIQSGKLSPTSVMIKIVW